MCPIRFAMVVDDDQNVLSQAQKALQGMGCLTVELFETSQAFQDKLSPENPPDVILLDMRMPQVSGATLLQIVTKHESEALRNVPVVPLIGVISEEEIALMGELDTSMFLKKPFTDKQLTDKVAEVIVARNDRKTDFGFKAYFQDCLSKKKFSEAFEGITQKVKENPKSVRYRCMLARLLFEVGKLAEAEAVLAKVLAVVPKNPQALNLMSQIALKKHDYKTALECLEKAQYSSPLGIERLLMMGELHMGENRHTLAEEKFRKALERHPQCEVARMGLVRSLAAQGRHDDAKKMLTSSEDKREVASFFNMRAILLSRSGHHTNAIAMYRAALEYLEEKEKEPYILFNIAIATFRNGEVHEAAKITMGILKRVPQFEKAKAFLEKVNLAIHEKRLGVKILSEEQSPIGAPQLALSDEQLERLLGGGLLRRTGFTQEQRNVPSSGKTPPTGTTSTGTTSTGATPTGATPTGATPTGATPTGATPTGATPTGTTPPAEQKASVAKNTKEQEGNPPTLKTIPEVPPAAAVPPPPQGQGADTQPAQGLKEQAPETIPAPPGEKPAAPTQPAPAPTLPKPTLPKPGSGEKKSTEKDEKAEDNVIIYQKKKSNRYTRF